MERDGVTPSEGISNLYLLGFGCWLQELIEREGYEITTRAETGLPDSFGCKLRVRNPIGEVFAIDIEHVREGRR